ncbi:MAG: methionyl-tRNA formyltransferase [Bacilli bacterium]
MKIVFMGTPVFCEPILEALIEKYNVVGVVTQPDKEVGRKKEILFSKVKEIALKHNIKIFQPIKIKEDYKDILELNPDIIITCAYGQIIPNEVLDYPKYGCINVHASLLPKLRGGAPIHRAIQYGHKETGITIMCVSEKMDSGDIISQESIKIEDNDIGGSLHDKLSTLGKNLLLKTLPDIIEGTNKRIKQNEDEVTYAWNVKREEERLYFTKTALEVYNHIRAFNPFPGTYFILNNKVFKVWDSYILEKEYKGKAGEIVDIIKDGIVIKTKDRNIVLTKIQPEGKNKMKVKDYLNGKGKYDFLIGKMLNI